MTIYFTRMVEDLLRNLEKRRQGIKMPLSIVARRSGVSLSTVYRVLRRFDGSVSATSVCAIAEALMAQIGLRTSKSDDKVLIEQVRMKARKITGMTQATAAMEGQAVNSAAQGRLATQLARRLLAVGTPRQIWG
jgi:DNA-binding LacI/PurR family transcriptional regulator